MTNQEIIQCLITVGREIECDVTPAERVLTSLRSCSHINRMVLGAWEFETSHLTNSELTALLKGITYVERELSWAGGSVAGVVWLFRILRNRSVTMEQIDKTAAWIVENTKNSYIPFGTSVSLGARNYSEYRSLSQERSRIIHKELENDKEIEKEAENQRQARKAKRAYSEQCRNSSIRTALIQKLNKMSVLDQLALISRDELYGPNFYPTRCADSADISVIESLSIEARHALVLKLKGRQRGPWGAFKKRLLSVCGSVGNKKPWRI